MRLCTTAPMHRALPRLQSLCHRSPSSSRPPCRAEQFHPTNFYISSRNLTSYHYNRRLATYFSPLTRLKRPILRTRPPMAPSADYIRLFSHEGRVPASDLPSFAFAFDIDGVLLRSSSPIPGASKALSHLHSDNIPFILLTNGGGKHESVRVLELTKKFGVPLTEENFVQSHTPFKMLVNGEGLLGDVDMEGLRDKNVLVTGGDGEKCRKVAEMYGFRSVITPGDILVAQPTIWPFNQIFSDYYRDSTRPLPSPINPSYPSASLKIDAIFVFNDPRDWALDTQIILDLLLSKNGVLGTYSEKNGDPNLPNNGWQQDGQPKLFFSNPDLFWATSYHLPRLGQGGFQACLEGVWNATTGGAKLERKVIGKPFRETYQYAERVLNSHRMKLLNGGANGALRRKVGPLHRVYMIGDNPESDIRGANEFQSECGTEWISVLVKTGVYQEREGMDPKYRPRVVVEDVADAVKWVLEREGWGAEGLVEGSSSSSSSLSSDSE